MKALLPLVLLSCAGCASDSLPSFHQQDVPVPNGLWSRTETPPGKLTIFHPSMHPEGLYKAIYCHPLSCPVNTNLGFILIVRNDKGNVIASTHVQSDDVKGALWVEFALGPETIRRSTLEFQIYPNTEKVTWVNIPLGKQESVRKLNGRIEREPIERNGL
jgi:hypothetical protein